MTRSAISILGFHPRSGACVPLISPRSVRDLAHKDRRRVLISRFRCYNGHRFEKCHDEIAWILKIAPVIPRRGPAADMPAGLRRKARGAGARQFGLSERGEASEPG